MGATFHLTPADVAEIEAAFEAGAAAMSRTVRGYATALNDHGSPRSARQVLAFVEGMCRQSEPSPMKGLVKTGRNPWLVWAIHEAREAGVEWSTIAFCSGQFRAGAAPEDVVRGTEREYRQYKARLIDSED